MGNRRAGYASLFYMLLTMFAGYVLLHDLLGGTLFAHSDWDSYSLQAMAWREGRLDLGRNYEWLELAVFGGKYYVSFPPVPTLLLLPFTFFFGENTPNNLIMMLLAMATAAAAWGILRRAGLDAHRSALCAFFYVWGSNMLFMSMNGGVWFMAQGCNLLLLTLALLGAQRGWRAAPSLFVALAVGCRPFSAFAFLPLFVYFLEKDAAAGLGWKARFRALLPACIAPLLCAAAYMALNYARFGNVFEFGHNYLPEFLESEHGQFSTAYLRENLYNLLLRAPSIEDGRLAFPRFNGFLFYVANPLFLLLFLRLARYLGRRLRGAKAAPFAWTRLCLLFAMALSILGLCLHKTLGGWQFGARYTVDMLPLALGAMLTLGDGEIGGYEYAIMGLGLLLNLYGCMSIWLLG